MGHHDAVRSGTGTRSALRWSVYPVSFFAAFVVSWWITRGLIGYDQQIAAAVSAPFATATTAGVMWWAGRGGSRSAAATREESDSAGPPAVPGAGPDRIVSGEIPGRAAAWQPRTQLSDRLRRWAENPDPAVMVNVVTGPTGAGKTQLAASCAMSCAEAGWPIVWWIWADAEDRLVAGLAGLADEMGAAADGPVATAKRALGWLATRPGPALLVYDGAVDPDLLGRWLPTVGNVRVIVTTTRQTMADLGEPMPVGTFSPHEARAYLQERTGLADPQGASAVADRLGRLPLALAQAAAVTGPQRPHPTWPVYLQRLQDVDISSRLAPVPGDPYPAGAAEAILLSIEDLAKRDRDGAARSVLDLLSVLSPGVTARWVLAASHDQETLDRAFALLVDSSLLVASTDGQLFSMHALVGWVARDARRHDDSLAPVVDRGAEMLATVAKQHHMGGWRRRQRGLHLVGHVETLATAARPCTDRISRMDLLLDLRAWAVRLLLQHLADTNRILGQAETLAADCEALLGTEHPTTVTSWNCLATAYEQASRYAEAVALFVRALVAAARIWGEDHEKWFTLSGNIAQAYSASGDGTKALAVYRRILPRQIEILGVAHHLNVIASVNLAILHLRADRPAVAIEMLEPTLELAMVLSGRDSFLAIHARHALAKAYLSTGRVTDGISLREENTSATERLLGPRHPLTLLSRHDQACAYSHDRGRLGEAVKLCRDALLQCERSLPEDDATTARVRRSFQQLVQARRDRRWWRRGGGSPVSLGEEALELWRATDE